MTGDSKLEKEKVKALLRKMVLINKSFYKEGLTTNQVPGIMAQLKDVSGELWDIVSNDSEYPDIAIGLLGRFTDAYSAFCKVSSVKELNEFLILRSEFEDSLMETVDKYEALK